MSLIERLDDKRLDDWSRDRHADKVNEKQIVALDSLRAALKRAEEAEARECRVREVADLRAQELSDCGPPQDKFEEGYNQGIRVVVENIRAALSSTGPCRHQEEAERWKEYAKHQEYCASCAESVDECPIGSEFKRRAEGGGE